MPIVGDMDLGILFQNSLRKDIECQVLIKGD